MSIDETSWKAPVAPEPQKSSAICYGQKPGTNIGKCMLTPPNFNITASVETKRDVKDVIGNLIQQIMEIFEQLTKKPETIKGSVATIAQLGLDDLKNLHGNIETSLKLQEIKETGNEKLLQEIAEKAGLKPEDLDNPTSEDLQKLKDFIEKKEEGLRKSIQEFADSNIWDLRKIAFYVKPGNDLFSLWHEGHAVKGELKQHMLEKLSLADLQKFQDAIDAHLHQKEEKLSNLITECLIEYNNTPDVVQEETIKARATQEGFAEIIETGNLANLSIEGLENLKEIFKDNGITGYEKNRDKIYDFMRKDRSRRDRIIDKIPPSEREGLVEKLKARDIESLNMRETMRIYDIMQTVKEEEPALQQKLTKEISSSFLENPPLFRVLITQKDTFLGESFQRGEVNSIDHLLELKELIDEIQNDPNFKANSYYYDIALLKEHKDVGPIMKEIDNDLITAYLEKGETPDDLILFIKDFTQDKTPQHIARCIERKVSGDTRNLSIISREEKSKAARESEALEKELAEKAKFQAKLNEHPSVKELLENPNLPQFIPVEKITKAMFRYGIQESIKNGEDMQKLEAIIEAVQEEPNLLDASGEISNNQVALFKKLFDIKDDKVARECLERFKAEQQDEPLILYAIEKTRSAISGSGNMVDLSLEEAIKEALKKEGKLGENIEKVFNDAYYARLNRAQQSWNSPASPTQPSKPVSPEQPQTLTEEQNPKKEENAKSTSPSKPVSPEQPQTLTEEQQAEIAKKKQQEEENAKRTAELFKKFGGGTLR